MIKLIIEVDDDNIHTQNITKNESCDEMHEIIKILRNKANYLDGIVDRSLDRRAGKNNA